MDRITQSNASSAEESASASEELSAQARELESTVSSLLQLVGGKINASSGPLNNHAAASVAPKNDKLLLSTSMCSKANHVEKAKSNGHGLENGNGINRLGKYLGKREIQSSRDAARR